jgi:hypothetical protein
MGGDILKVIRKKGKGADELKWILQGLRDNHNVKTGWFESAKYDDKKSTPVAQVAAENEFGNPRKGIPARSFMRTTVRAKRAEWKALIADWFKQFAQGKLTIEQVFDRIGLKSSGDIREKITQIMSPKLSERTIEARKKNYAQKTARGVKGIEKPLIDTGIMLNELTYVKDDKK